jgi:glycerol uptake facilitator protein
MTATLSGGEILLWEFLGTAALILLGAGVVANVLLTRTNADGDTASWVLITFGWGFAVFIGASIADPSGGVLNPALAVGTAIAGKTPWWEVPWMIVGELLGAFVGAVLAWLVYKLQFDANEDNSGTLNIFSTNPPIRKPVWNMITELIATFLLVLFLLENPYGSSPAIYGAAGALVAGIGMSLGGPTGYAINPARDLGPRIAYAVLPIKGKGKPEWGYSWVPIVGPLIGAALAGLLSLVLPATS